MFPKDRVHRVLSASRHHDDRGKPHHLREKGREMVESAEDHRRPEYRVIEPGGPDNLLGFPLCPVVAAHGPFPRAKRAHVQEAGYSHALARLDHGPRAVHMDSAKARAPGLGEDAYEVDDSFYFRGDCLEYGRYAGDIALMELAGRAGHGPGLFKVTGEHAHPDGAVEQFLYYLVTD